MGTNRFYVLTSVFILIILGYLVYRTLQPFLVAIAWASVFAIVFYPAYTFMLKFVKSKFVASLISVVVILFVIIGPLFSLVLVLVDELKTVVEKMDKEALDYLKTFMESPQIAMITKRIQAFIGVEDISAVDIIMGNLKRFSESLLKNFSQWISNMTKIIIDFILMLFAVFFFLKDGPDFLIRIRKYLPFSEEQENRLASQIKDMIVSTVYGGVVVAVVQGTLGGIAFYALDIKSPVLWGTAMAIMSFLPMLGTFTVWGPVSGYLFLNGFYLKGAGLLLFGTLVIGIVDNILKPIIISGRTKVPTLLIFFSVLGGINYFGFIGFILGPLVLALFMSVFAIFRNIEEGGSNA